MNEFSYFLIALAPIFCYIAGETARKPEIIQAEIEELLKTVEK